MKIGIDIVQVERIKKDLKIAKRILTPRELELFLSFSAERQIEFLAGRWAAKEAIIKCDKTLKRLDIQILINEDESPLLNLDKYQISISHEHDYAVAVALKVD